MKTTVIPPGRGIALAPEPHVSTPSRRASRGLRSVLLLACLLLAATAAHAQPANDTIAGATKVSTLPFTDPAVSFATATDDIAPAVSNSDCGGSNLHGVWYKFTPAVTGDVTITISSPSTLYTILLYTAADENADDSGDLTPTITPCAIRSTITVPDATAGQAYYVFVGNDDGSSVGQPSDVAFTGDATLPVELTAFAATADGDAVELRWTTASETNNAGFEVQHLQDGAWVALGFVEGRGTTSEPRAYRYRAEAVAPGLSRFRLKQVDYDGAFAYSPEVEAQVETPGAYVLSSVYPNPFNPRAQFSLALQQTQEVRVVLYDLMGREVGRLHDGVLEGGTTHRFEIDGAALSLSSGVYLIRLTGERFDAAQRVTLIK